MVEVRLFGLSGSVGEPMDSTSIRHAIVGAPVAPVPPDSLPRLASGAQIAQFVALRAAACVGADYSNLALLDKAGDSLRVYQGPFWTQRSPIATPISHWMPRFRSRQRSEPVTSSSLTVPRLIGVGSPRSWMTRWPPVSRQPCQYR
jgi:hypothetical protein